MSRLARIAFIGTGGTIASLGRDPMDLVNYGETGTIMHADEILERLPLLSQFADVVPVRYRNMPAIEIGPNEWLSLNEKIHEVAEQGKFDGIVLTHGTASLEETAYFLNLTLKIDIPVVLVGSQRPFNAISSDAQANLINAVRTAASADARGKGVLVVMNNEIQAAREVTKTDTYRLQSFQSPGLGVLGYADADRIVFYRASTRRHTKDSEFDVRELKSLPRVDLVVSYAGADGLLINAARAGGARGIVSAGFAPGFGSPAETEALGRAVEAGLVVVQSARAHSGRVDLQRRIERAGFIAADNLPAHKARILLMLALNTTSSREAIQELFWSH